MADKKCTTCNGTGQITTENFALNLVLFGAPIPIFKNTQVCTSCKGTGKKK